MERKEIIAKYEKNTHRLGKLASLITLILLIGAPFLIGNFLGAAPDLAAAGRGFLAVGLVWTISSVVEFLVYTPMLGSGGGYLAMITGNLINMKIPCAVHSRDLAGVKAGTKENEIVSTLSIAVSSLVTVLVLAAGVLLLQPLLPVLESRVLRPAFDQVVPALFGAMAFRYYRGHLKLALWPLLLMSALFILVPSLRSQTSIMILPSGALAILLAWFGWKKERAAG